MLINERCADFRTTHAANKLRPFSGPLNQSHCYSFREMESKVKAAGDEAQKGRKGKGNKSQKEKEGQGGKKSQLFHFLGCLNPALKLETVAFPYLPSPAQSVFTV